MPYVSNPLLIKKRVFFVVVVVVLSTPKSRSRNSKPGYVSRKERCPSHREEDMRRCLLKSPACAPKDNSCYQDGTSDGAYYEIGGARTCDRGSWEESHVSQLLSSPQRKAGKQLKEAKPCCARSLMLSCFSLIPGQILLSDWLNYLSLSLPFLSHGS